MGAVSAIVSESISVAGLRTSAKTTLRTKRATFVPCRFRSTRQNRPKCFLLCRWNLLVHRPSIAVTAVAQYCAEAVKLRCVPPEELLRERAKVRPRRALT